MNFTKEEILKMCSKLYAITGIETITVNELDKNASVEDFNIAWLSERNYFRGVADTIYNYT